MNKKRVLSLLLALVMVFGAFAPTISMAEAEDVYVKVVQKDGETALVGATVKAVNASDEVLAEATTEESGVVTLNVDKANVEKFVVEFNGKEVTLEDEKPSLDEATTEKKAAVLKTNQVVEKPGDDSINSPSSTKAEKVPFQIVDQNNHVLAENIVKVTKLQFKASGSNAWEDIEVADVVLGMEDESAAQAYRLLALTKDEGFEDGEYRITFAVEEEDGSLVDTEFEFKVDEGKVKFPENEEFFRIDIDVVVKQFNYKLRVVDCDLNGLPEKEFSVFAIEKEDGKYVYEDNKPVPASDDAIYTFTTNKDGFAGLTYDVNPDGSVSIVNGDVTTTVEVGTLLVIVDDNNPANRQVFNLWKLKDEVKYATTPVEKILEEPIKYLEARKDAHNNFVECEKDAITLRVRVETMPFTAGEAKPVPGAKVEVGLPKAYAYGTALEWGETVATGVTDKYGYVEFELPVKQAIKVWGQITAANPGDEDDLTAEYQLLELTMPYLVRQVDNGNNEGVSFNDRIYVMEDEAKKVDDKKVYELIIRNNVDLADRLGGANRYETAVKMAERLFPNGLQVKDNYKNVVIASGDSYPDALTATTTAYNYNAPLLLTQKGQLPKETAEYLKKVNPSRIVIVGGTQTINEAVEKELEAFGKIKRISGLNRYGTSVENAKDLLRWIMDNNETKWVHGHFGDKGVVYMASGENFPDALAAASPAAVAGSPLLLTMKNQLPKEVKDFIIANKAKEVRVIGGTGSVSDAVIRELRDSNLTANRIAGLDRSATSVEIAKEFYPNANHVFVTSGAGYADALTGATLAAKEKSPVLLLPNADTVSDAVKAYLETYDVTSFTILGGTGTVSEKARTEINNIILGR